MADVDGSVLQPAQLQPEVEAQISPEVQPQDAPQDRAVSRTATPTIERNPSQKKPQNMNGPLYMQSAGNKNVRFVPRNRKQDDSALVLLARWFVENQIGLSFNLLALLFLAHYFIPKAQPHTAKFFTLSYRNPATGSYKNGCDDMYFIAFCVILFTGLRAATMEYVLAPFAKTWGVRKTKDLTRFSEQSWMLVYYIIFWSMGLYIYCTSSYFLNLQEMWTNWPVRELNALNKFYTLAQSAFWIQQIIVINIEERRNDHWQMLTHHIITLGLLFSCYAYHQTRVGNVILVIMDVGDIFLPLAKCLKYMGFTTVCDVMFGVFLTYWIVARHVLYPMVCWSIYTDIPNIIGEVCYKGSDSNLQGPFPVPETTSYLLEPFWDSEGMVCFGKKVTWYFLVPLLLLQCLIFAWFVLIARVAIKVIRGGSAEDNRSDDEAEEEDDFVYEEAPLEEEVGVEELHLKSWERRSGVKRQASSSGVSLPSHSDRKELLGRIGCEKQVD
ncbi:hypothetical protein VD0004_g8442 [Verticillium dahliae]|uniref:Uncharacterized protein n=1 Tax=Verticillium dahliae TaxID=27337 RepID=A0A366PD44_VERDA|nr:Histone acetyltransferase type B subunit 2 [Verticillium dahliae VDG1]KAG7126718.1 Sphingosine N-acyltransferase-like protein FUM18 like [Verticillium longisporum]PNH38385.1 hypothetical protein VD0004_g8442 [Verticillium dahliae]PNH71137.1 hypothetical protein VD0001_g6403 [Verticillium dahliae]RBQ89897.1 hypothetical protein VDGD_02761 [Verticillium dahliae]